MLNKIYEAPFQTPKTIVISGIEDLKEGFYGYNRALNHFVSILYTSWFKLPVIYVKAAFISFSTLFFNSVYNVNYEFSFRNEYKCSIESFNNRSVDFTKEIKTATLNQIKGTLKIGVVIGSSILTANLISSSLLNQSFIAYALPYTNNITSNILHGSVRLFEFLNNLGLTDPLLKVVSVASLRSFNLILLLKSASIIFINYEKLVNSLKEEDLYQEMPMLILEIGGFYTSVALSFLALIPFNNPYISNVELVGVVTIINFCTSGTLTKGLEESKLINKTWVGIKDWAKIIGTFSLTHAIGFNPILMAPLYASASFGFNSCFPTYKRYRKINELREEMGLPKVSTSAMNVVIRTQAVLGLLTFGSLILPSSIVYVAGMTASSLIFNRSIEVLFSHRIKELEEEVLNKNNARQYEDRVTNKVELIKVVRENLGNTEEPASPRSRNLSKSKTNLIKGLADIERRTGEISPRDGVIKYKYKLYFEERFVNWVSRIFAQNNNEALSLCKS